MIAKRTIRDGSFVISCWLILGCLLLWIITAVSSYFQNLIGPHAKIVAITVIPAQPVIGLKTRLPCFGPSSRLLSSCCASLPEDWKASPDRKTFSSSSCSHAARRRHHMLNQKLTDSKTRVDSESFNLNDHKRMQIPVCHEAMVAAGPLATSFTLLCYRQV